MSKPNKSTKNRRISKSYNVLLFSLFAGATYLVLNITGLEKQGLYYDEVFQATASFAYIGQPTHQFSVLEFHNIPLMNMNYIGAIKTGIYGLFLRLSGESFSTVSWRLTGIIFVTISFFLFSLIVGNKIKPAYLFIFQFLFITDTTILLTTRFDWGPVALSLSIRLIMVAVWIRGELSDNFKPKNSFIISFLFSLAVFEKLSAIVLIIPVLIMLFSNAKRRNIQHIKMFFLGGLTGSIPLILINIYSYFQKGYFISLQNQAVYFTREHNLDNFFQFIKRYLSLGAGGEAKSFILGISQSISGNLYEISIISLILITILAAYLFTNIKDLRLSIQMLVCYFIIAICLYFLPARNWIHHWVIGTPFQYSAILLSIHSLEKQRSLKTIIFYKYILVLFLTLLTLIRFSGINLIEQAYQRGDSSTQFQPAYTQIAEFAVKKSEEAIYFTGDWGVANQIICFLNGKPDVIYQINWKRENANNIVKSVSHILNNTEASDIYFIFPDPPIFTEPEAREVALLEIEKEISPQWQETMLDQEIKHIEGLIIYKYYKFNH